MTFWSHCPHARDQWSSDNPHGIVLRSPRGAEVVHVGTRYEILHPDVVGRARRVTADHDFARHDELHAALKRFGGWHKAATPTGIALERVRPLKPPRPLRNRLCVVTASTPDRSRFADMTLGALGLYCGHWGYDLVNRDDFTHARPPAWSKVRFLREQLERYDFVAWFDDDVLVLDRDCPLESFLDPEMPVVASWDSHYGVNTGVVLAEAGKASKILLDVWWDSWDFREYECLRDSSEYEQAMFKRLLEDDDRVYGAVSLLPYAAMNGCPHERGYSPGDFSLHVSALPYDRRESLIRDFARRPCK